MMTPSQTGALVARLVAMYPRQEIRPETVAGYCRFLADLDPDIANAAVDEWIAAERFFPTVAELRRVAALRMIGAPDGEAAWVDILAGQAPAHPIARRSLEAIGGMWSVKTSERPDLTRRDFIAAYEALLRRAVAELVVDPVIGIDPPDTPRSLMPVPK